MKNIGLLLVLFSLIICADTAKASNSQKENLENISNAEDMSETWGYELFEHIRNEEVVDLELVKELLDKGATPNIENYISETTLFFAIQNIEVLKLLIEAGVDVNTNDGEALLVASDRGYLKAVQCLIEAGADVNIKHYYYGTALISASAQGHLEIVKYLVEKGADIHAETLKGKTALMKASESGHTEIVDYLRSKGALTEPKNYKYSMALIEAVKDGNLKEAKKAVENGANLEIITDVEEDSQTLLILAAESGHLEIVKYLSGQGADVNAMSLYGSPILYASGAGHLEVVQYLVEKGADVNNWKEYDDGQGDTALMWASGAGHLEVVKFLVENGADVNVSRESYTPFYSAIFGGHLEIVKYLVENGADIHSTNEGGKTALDYALSSWSKDQPEIAEYLKTLLDQG